MSKTRMNYRRMRLNKNSLGNFTLDSLIDGFNLEEAPVVIIVRKDELNVVKVRVEQEDSSNANYI